MARLRTSVLAFLLASATAQQESYLDIIFSPSDTGNCGRNRDVGITFSLTSIPSESSCYNFNSTFQSSPTSSQNYTLSDTSNFSPTTTYSQIYYQHPNDSPNPSSNVVADVELLIYSGLNCQQSNNSDDDVQPYYRWNCFDAAGHCTTLDYGVASFEIRPVNESQRSGSCDTGVEYESEASAMGMGRGWWGVVVGVAAVGCAMGMS